MNLDEIINSMTPEVYQRLSTAVELGKWPDGVALTPEQKETACNWLCYGRRGTIPKRNI